MDELKTNTCGCGHDHEHEHGEDCGCGEHATMMLQLDDGSELKCTVLGIFDVEEIEGKEYIALLREDNDEVLMNIAKMKMKNLFLQILNLMMTMIRLKVLLWHY